MNSKDVCHGGAGQRSVERSQIPQLKGQQC